MENFERMPVPDCPEPFLEGKKETDEQSLAELRRRVRENYGKNGVPDDLIEQFTIHNLQVEDFVRIFSESEGFDEKEKEIAILSAILHDVAKGYGEFLAHGEEGGRMAKVMLIDLGLGEELAESVRLGIERHMGQEGYPAENAKKRYGEGFSFPAPRTKVGDMLYKCDILTQLTPEGFAKILLIRKSDPVCACEDDRVAQEKGISREAAARLSALESARKSYDVIMRDSAHPLPSLQAYAQELWSKLEQG